MAAMLRCVHPRSQSGPSRRRGLRRPGDPAAAVQGFARFHGAAQHQQVAPALQVARGELQQARPAQRLVAGPGLVEGRFEGGNGLLQRNGGQGGLGGEKVEGQHVLAAQAQFFQHLGGGEAAAGA